MAKTAYISGPISNKNDKNRQAFKDAQFQLECFGYKVINPIDLSDEHPTWTERQYIRKDLFDMLSDEVTVIALLPGWRESVGATTEVFVANRYHIPLIDAISLEPIKIYTEFELCEPKR